MTLGHRTLKALWGRAAARCSFPGCRVDLYRDDDESDDPTHVGENCHIISERDGGPRSDPSVSSQRINSYQNLILLCRNHHRVIDDPINGEREYTIETLYQMKRDHETWIRNELGIDEERQRDEEYYAQIVEEWEEKCHVETWTALSSHILWYGQPRMHKEISSDLTEARRWLMNRVWPHRYASLDRAFANFRIILVDFQNLFLREAEERGEFLVTRKFYHINEWNEARYNELFQNYEYHVSLVEDLMLELTRAANLICDEIRENLMYWYRRDRGRLVVQSGPHDDLSVAEMIVQYSDEERRGDFPYRGLEDFRNARSSRDFYFGRGLAPN